MREPQRLQRTIIEAFGDANHAVRPDRDIVTVDVPRALNGSNLRQIALVLAATACLIVAGVTAGDALSIPLAGILLLGCAIALGINLLQMVRNDIQNITPDTTATNQALARVERESAMKSRLLATVSHDIRTPLSGIAGMSNLLADTRLTPEQANYLASIRQSTAALAQLVDDLLDFSSLEAGRFKLRPRTEAPRQLIENVVEMLAPRAHAKGIEIASCVSAAVPETLVFDPGRLRQVLYNLVGNAVKFTAQGGVLVNVGFSGGKLQIDVCDTGPGMSEEEQERVFQEFEQAGSEIDKASGTGLGLSIASRIVTQAGGTLTVTSEEGQGSTFSIRLPAVSANADQFAPSRRSELSQSRVLLVMPPGVSRDALRTTILTLGGQCDVASNAQQARSACEKATNGFTDVIADHRLNSELLPLMRTLPELCHGSARRIVLVDPESRRTQLTGAGYDSWLIRPLRERSLTGVLLGRMKGIELRDPLNDNRSDGTSRWTQTAEPGLDILLGEDDPVNRLLLSTVLRKSGHRVEEAENFRQLIERATATGVRPAVIITDLNMPGGNGFDTLAAIREHERSRGLAELPIIVVTAAQGPESRRQAIEAGATEYLAKPADPQQLRELLSAYRSMLAG